MTSPDSAASCLGCNYEWNTKAMVEGLRLIGSCPRCGGELAYAEPAPLEPAADAPQTAGVGSDSRAPHMVLGMPRDW